jgi:hypothetical protein
MHSNMSKVECDVLMHLLHRQCVLRFHFSYMPLPNIQRLFVSGTPLTPRTGRLVLHAFRYNSKPVISVATARPPYPACCS